MVDPRNDALEAAARVSEAQQQLAYDGYDLTGFYSQNAMCRSIAAAIRALKTPVAKEGERP